MKFRGVQFLLLFVLVARTELLLALPLQKPRVIPSHHQQVHFFSADYSLSVDLDGSAIHGHRIERERSSKRSIRYILREPVALNGSKRAALQGIVFQLKRDSDWYEWCWDCDGQWIVSTPYGPLMIEDAELRAPTSAYATLWDLFMSLNPEEEMLEQTIGIGPRSVIQPDRQWEPSILERLQAGAELNIQFSAEEKAVHLRLLISNQRDNPAKTDLYLSGQSWQLSANASSVSILEVTKVPSLSYEKLLPLLKTKAIEQAAKNCLAAEIINDSWTLSAGESRISFSDEPYRFFYWPQENRCNSLSGGEIFPVLREAFESLYPHKVSDVPEKTIYWIPIDPGTLPMHLIPVIGHLWWKYLTDDISRLYRTPL